MESHDCGIHTIKIDNDKSYFLTSTKITAAEIIYKKIKSNPIFIILSN